MHKLTTVTSVLAVALGGAVMAQAPEVPAVLSGPIPVLMPDSTDINTVTEGEWTLLDAADQPWSICVSLPTMKDPYWRAVDYGLVSHAQRLGVELTVLEAGGYDNLSKQISDLEDCTATGADAILVAAISGEGVQSKVNQIIADGTPVIEAINRIASPNVTARSTLDFKRLGFATGEYIVEQAGGELARVAWFPGAEGAGWAVRADEGFREALEDSSVEIVSTKWGDTARDVQMRLVEDTLQAEASLDWVVGVAAAAESAVGVLRDIGRTEVRIGSFYQTDAVASAINAGEIAFAGNDNVVWMAAIALDLAVRKLQGEDIDGTEIWPRPAILTSDTRIDIENSSGFAPKEFQPVFQVP